MKARGFYLGLIIFTIFISISLCADNPTINVQGVLRDSDGRAVADGQQPMEFKFFDAESDGTQIGSWVESISVLVINGIYNVQLGATEPLSGLAFDRTYFLEITVDGNIMNPRLPLSLTPYSLSVRGLDNVFPSTGNVGIGTTDPVSKLHVINEEANTRLTIARTDGDDEAYLQFRTGNVNKALIGLDDGSDNLSIYSYDGAGVITTFEGDTGNVGIGTSDPDATLEIDGNLHVSGEDISNSYENVFDGDIKANDMKLTGGLVINDDSSGIGLDISRITSLGFSGWNSSIRLSNAGTQAIHHSNSGLFMGFHTNDLLYFGNSIDDEYYMYLGADGMTVLGIMAVSGAMTVNGTIKLASQTSAQADCSGVASEGTIRYDHSNGNFYGWSSDANDNGTPGDYGWVKLNE